VILNLRGTSGSGKTTVVRGLMAKFPINEVVGEEKKPYGYECRPDRTGLAPYDSPVADAPNLYIVGSYKNTCGGCDGIDTQDEICNRVRFFAPQGDVVFEGLLISHLYSRYLNLDREMAKLHGQRTIWAFLDTPLELCLERVKTRRDERAALKGKEASPFNPDNTIAKWNDMRRVFKKCQADKLDCRWLSHTNSTEEAWGWLQNYTTKLSPLAALFNSPDIKGIFPAGTTVGQ
jgi:hypothetical protein